MKTPERDERVTIGKIVKTRGLHGEVKVYPLTDIPDRFEHLETVLVQLAQGPELVVEIVQVKYYKDLVYLQFRGRNTLNEVQELVGGLLQVDPASVPELPEGVYYHFEIIGSEVYTDDAQRLGVVVEILETGSNDIYVVQADGREYLIPVIADVVKEIDREKRMITIHPLPGLLEL